MLEDEERDEIAQSYRQGVSVYELARRFGIHRQTVSAALEQANAPRRYNQLSPDQLEKAHHLATQGWTIVMLAERFAVPPSTMQYGLARWWAQTQR